MKRPKKAHKPIIAVDFDGVIHAYTSGWKGAGNIPDKPIKGAFEFLRSCFSLFDVQIFSSRSATTVGRKAMAAWFIKHGWPTELTGEPLGLGFPRDKPLAKVLLDDHGVRFMGPDKWPTPEKLFAMTTWKKTKV